MNEKILMEVTVNSFTALASAQALRDVLLQTQEQKDAFNEKYKHYVEKHFTEFGKAIGVENPEKLFEIVHKGVSEI